MPLPVHGKGQKNAEKGGGRAVAAGRGPHLCSRPFRPVPTQSRPTGRRHPDPWPIRIRPSEVGICVFRFFPRPLCLTARKRRPTGPAHPATRRGRPRRARRRGLPCGPSFWAGKTEPPAARPPGQARAGPGPARAVGLSLRRHALQGEPNVRVGSGGLAAGAATRLGRRTGNGRNRLKRAGAGLWRPAAARIFVPAHSRQFPPILGPPIPAPLVGGIRLAGGRPPSAARPRRARPAADSDPPVGILCGFSGRQPRRRAPLPDSPKRPSLRSEPPGREIKPAGRERRPGPKAYRRPAGRIARGGPA